MDARHVADVGDGDDDDGGKVGVLGRDEVEFALRHRLRAVDSPKIGESRPAIVPRVERLLTCRWPPVGIWLQ